MIKRGTLILVMIFVAALSSVGAQEDPDRPVIVPDNVTRLGQVALLERGRNNAIWDLAWSPDGSTLAVVDPRGVWLYAVDDFAAAPGRLRGNTGWVHTVTYSPDGLQLASGGYDGLVQLWDPLAGDTVAVMETESSAYYALAFSPDGSLLAGGGHAGEVYLWDAATGEVRGVLLGHDAVPVLTVAFSPDGTLLASGAEDNHLLVWDVASRTLVTELEGEHTDVYSVAFSPDGTLLAAGSSRGQTLQLWDLQSQESLTLSGQMWEVYSVEFSPQGDLLAAAGIGFEQVENTNSVLVRASETGDILLKLEDFASPVDVLAFSPDGTLLATGSQEGKVCVWGIDATP